MADTSKLAKADIKGGARVAGKAAGGKAAAAAEGEDYAPQGIDDRFQSTGEKGNSQLILEPDRTLIIGFVFIAVVLGFHFMGFLFK